MSIQHARTSCHAFTINTPCKHAATTKHHLQWDLPWRLHVHSARTHILPRIHIKTKPVHKCLQLRDSMDLAKRTTNPHPLTKPNQPKPELDIFINCIFPFTSCQQRDNNNFSIRNIGNTLFCCVEVARAPERLTGPSTSCCRTIIFAPGMHDPNYLKVCCRAPHAHHFENKIK